MLKTHQIDAGQSHANGFAAAPTAAPTSNKSGRSNKRRGSSSNHTNNNSNNNTSNNNNNNNRQTRSQTEWTEEQILERLLEETTTRAGGANSTPKSLSRVETRLGQLGVLTAPNTSADTSDEENLGLGSKSEAAAAAADNGSNDEGGQFQRAVGSKAAANGKQHGGLYNRLANKPEANGEAKAATAAAAAAATPEEPFKAQVVWRNIILFIILHSCLPIGVYMIYTQRPWKTLLFSVLGMYLSGLGVTGGAHRLWSHRSYKAKWPVQVILMILQTMAGQNSIYTWSRDHRVHHKFSETNADPHNIKRGFFFAHMGWLCCRKHPDVKEKGKLIDMSDLEANPYVMFQHRHFWWMAALFTVLVPTMIPVLLWGERFWTSFVFSFMVRYLITLHGTWLVNSAAHYYGERPYDSAIEARESPPVIYTALGEGFHNYHHTFPYDYATSEFGKYMNITTGFIDLCAAVGLVQDRRKVDRETIMKRRIRTGDLHDDLQKLAPLLGGAGQVAAGNNNYNKKTSQTTTNGCNRRTHKTIDEDEDELSSVAAHLPNNSPLAPLNNIIHELPYISGLTSMKYTM